MPAFRRFRSTTPLPNLSPQPTAQVPHPTRRQSLTVRLRHSRLGIGVIAPIVSLAASAIVSLVGLFIPRAVAQVDKPADLRAMPEVRRAIAVSVGKSSGLNQPDRGPSAFTVDEQPDRLRIAVNGQTIVEFVFRDDKIRRPFFANARLVDGRQITRNHPPVNGVDALDHDTMHPGIWLGFGDISQQDFWRNRATMEHVRFVVAPRLENGQLRFASECGLKSASGDLLGVVVHDCTLVNRPTGWLLAWRAEFRAGQRPIVFGDQEEMGFGARVATPFIEKNGGVIRNSAGTTTAKNTWGQSAAWCDYSGDGPKGGGIMLMASRRNFRESWWHNRDYGVFVANPFGRAAMKQGDRSSVAVAPGESLRLEFGALVHDQRAVAGDAEFTAFQQLIAGQGPPGK